MHNISFYLLTADCKSEVIPLLYPGAGIQALFGIGDKFSMFLSDTPVDGYMLDIIQGNTKKLTSIELPDCRYVNNNNNNNDNSSILYFSLCISINIITP